LMSDFGENPLPIGLPIDVRFWRKSTTNRVANLHTIRHQSAY
jgi:hypothetical protein